MVTSDRHKFRLAAPLVIALALVLAPVLCCCANGITPAAEAAVKALAGDDCAHTAVPAQDVDTAPEKDQRDCDDCVKISKTQSPPDTVGLSQEKRQFDRGAAVMAPDDRAVFGSVDPGDPNRHRGPTPPLRTTLVTLSVLLLV